MNTIDILGDDETFRQILERSITSFEDNELTKVGRYSFYGCDKLTDVSIPNATTIDEYAFRGCTNLNSLGLPKVTRMDNYAFSGCSLLPEISFPLLTTVPLSAFSGCTALSAFNLPKVTRINNSAFSNSSLTSAEFPLVTRVAYSAFSNCKNLSAAKLPKATIIESYAFDNCSSMASIIVGTELDDETAICTLESTSSFPSSIGAIYVPYRLQDKYKTATNWSSFADKIQAYDVPISCQSLTITAEDVPWYKTSTIIHYEAVCTYSIKGMMQTGTKVFKGDIVSNTFSTNTSEESSRQVEISYTFLSKTATTTITQERYRTDLVGGAIFYIDSSADGVYEFYNINGELISDVAVGDKPYSYRIITPGSKDKYYILHDEPYTSLRWTYYKNGSYVYTSLGATGTEIGTGKSNTATVLAADDGAYAAANSNGYPTIWYKLQQIRNAYTGGNNDWFVPSQREMQQALMAGLIPSPYHNSYLWSSSELSSDSRTAWSVRDTSAGSSDKSTTSLPVFFIRAF